MNEGIKMWQKAKGFRFDESSAGVLYTEALEKMVGKTGTITGFYGDRFYITFDDNSSHAYPVNEYLAILREERLKELGI